MGMLVSPHYATLNKKNIVTLSLKLCHKNMCYCIKNYNWHQSTLWVPRSFFFSVNFNEFDAAAAMGILVLPHYATFNKKKIVTLSSNMHRVHINVLIFVHSNSLLSWPKFMCKGSFSVSDRISNWKPRIGKILKLIQSLFIFKAPFSMSISTCSE